MNLCSSLIRISKFNNLQFIGGQYSIPVRISCRRKVNLDTTKKSLESSTNVPIYVMHMTNAMIHQERFILRMTPLTAMCSRRIPASHTSASFDFITSINWLLMKPYFPCKLNHNMHTYSRPLRDMNSELKSKISHNILHSYPSAYCYS